MIQRLILCALCWLQLPALATEKTAQTLEQVRRDIKAVESGIASDRRTVVELQQALKALALGVDHRHRELRLLEHSILDHEAELTKLKQQRGHQQQALSEHQQRLAEQIRIAHRNAHGNTLKLLLHQQEPAQLGRNLNYHRLVSRARRQRMDELLTTLADLQDIEAAISRRTTELAEKRDQQRHHVAQLEQQQREKAVLSARVQERIGSGTRRLQSLRDDEQRLSALMQQLQREAKARKQALAAAGKPFKTRRGTLPWPVDGRLLKRFGSTRQQGGQQGGLKWQGIIIGTDSGTEVQSIAPGQVVFADWFRNLGLLVIIDHGDGYMSLYGHNQSLFVSEGQRVRAGQVVAGSGSDDGGEHVGLYFEIRTQGKPGNPLRWLAKR